MQHALIDEYRLIVFPIVVGREKRLFGDASDTRILNLTDTKTLDSGVVVLSYGAWSKRRDRRRTLRLPYVEMAGSRKNASDFARCHHKGA